MRITNYDEVRNQVKEKLSDYLASHGITSQNNFKCINPQHAESNPSCGILKDKTHFHCLGCGITGDIFDACHFIEGKPNSGPLFVSENLCYLAKKFGVEVHEAELTEEQAFELDCYRAYAAAAEIINQRNPDGCTSAIEEIARRGWKGETLSASKTGYIKSPEALAGKLIAMGFDDKLLTKIGLTDPNIFNGNNIIFTITDESGRPVGFSARNSKWTSDSKDPKYYNTGNSRSTLYQKSRRLFNLSNALRDIRTKKLPLYIMEGYADVLTAVQYGITNCCAIGGTALTSDHVLLLKDLGIEEIILCLDGDEAGQDKTQKILDNKFSGKSQFSLSVIVVPEGKDPDDFIRENGVEEFEALMRWSAFEWRLIRFPEDADPADVCKAMIPIIINEISFVVQEQLATMLARHTGVSLRTIQAELDRLQDVRSHRIAQERAAIIDKLNHTIEGSPSDAEVALNTALMNLQELNKKYNEDKLSEDACLTFLDGQRKQEELKSNEFGGFRLGPDLKQFEDALCGQWRRDVLMVFGGKANSGKTSFLAKAGYEIAAHKENDACVIYHTIDDTAEQFLPKWVCIAEGSRLLQINHVRSPNYWGESVGLEGIKERRSDGYERLRNLMRDGRLVLKDSNDGSTLAYAESLIKYYKDKYPTRNIVYILDNFHKLNDYSSEDERIRFKSLSQAAKSLATKYHIPVICTMEYTKLPAGVKPTNNNIAETVQIEYDANVIAHLYNESHELGIEAAEKTGLTHNYMFNGQLNKLPVIELYIGKNKVSDFKNRIFFDFFPASSDFMARDTAEVEEQMKTNSDAQATTRKSWSNDPNNKPSYGKASLFKPGV